MKYRIIDIIKGTTVDGPGFRTSIYFAGCRHNCPECHNPQSWNFNAGRDYSLEEIMEIIMEEEFDVTFSGGDPLYQAQALPYLIKEIRKAGLKVWIYTGFTWDEILDDPLLFNAVKDAEVVVEGPFDKNLHDPDLIFRGSTNQRIIDVNNSISLNKPILYIDT